MVLYMKNKINFDNSFSKMFTLKARMTKGNMLIEVDELYQEKNLKDYINIKSEVYVEESIISYP